MNKIPKILGILLKISGLLENPNPGSDANKVVVPSALGIMTLPGGHASSANWPNLFNESFRPPYRVSSQASMMGLTMS